MLAFVQTYVQRLLEEGVPGASRLDPDGDGIACEELLSAGGGQSASFGSASPIPTVSPTVFRLASMVPPFLKKARDRPSCFSPTISSGPKCRVAANLR